MARVVRIEAMGNIAYEHDVIAWSREQARLLREGQWARLDIEHLADEIEDVGKAESRELASRMALLIGHLLKWAVQPERRGASWQRTINEQRKALRRRIAKTPSFKAEIIDPEWIADAWLDGWTLAMKETGHDFYPEACPWTIQRVLDDDFWPDHLAD
ncbi:MAG: DUF29 domain-containing protein [Sphingomonadaceae bacterium]